MSANNHVVYIEDDKALIKLVEQILVRAGYTLTGVAHGEDAVDTLKQVRPDVILLDLMMPDMSGWDVYHQIKSHAEINDIPVIVVTARYQSADRVMGEEIEHVDGYIVKPFMPKELVESVRRVLSQSQAQTDGSA